MRNLVWLVLAFPLLCFGCSSESDKSVTISVKENEIAQPTKQSSEEGGGVSAGEAKIEDRTKPEVQ